MKQGKNERVNLKELRGFCSDKIAGAMQEMDAIGGASECEKFVYHASINPALSEHLTPEQMLQAVDILEQHLKLEDHQRVIVSHEKDGREHYHIAWNRVDPETMKAVTMSHNYRAHEEAAREIERTFGLEQTQGRHTGGGPEPERGPKQWESDRGRRSGIDPRSVSAEISEIWRTTESGEDFRAAIEGRGYLLATGENRAFLIVDQNGDPHSLSRRAKVKAAEVRERFADFEKLPTLEEARATQSENSEKSAEQDRQKSLEKAFAALQRGKIQKTVNENEGFLDCSIALQDQGFDIATNKYGQLVAVAENGFSYRVKASEVQSAELKELQGEGLILPSVEAIREERKAAREAKKAEREAIQAERAKRREEYAEKKKERAARLGSTLYDRGDMASQQQDALLHAKDHGKAKEAAAKAQQNETLQQEKAKAAQKDREERAKAAQAQKPQRGEQTDRKQRYSQREIMEDLFRANFGLAKRKEEGRSNDWDRERER